MEGKACPGGSLKRLEEEAAFHVVTVVRRMNPHACCGYFANIEPGAARASAARRGLSPGVAWAAGAQCVSNDLICRR